MRFIHNRNIQTTTIHTTEILKQNDIQNDFTHAKTASIELGLHYKISHTQKAASIELGLH